MLTGYMVPYFVYILQDNNGPGTVLDHKTTAGWVRVRWDNGDVNSYRMGAEGATDLIRTGFGTQTTTSSTYNPTYRTTKSTPRTTMAGSKLSFINL